MDQHITIVKLIIVIYHISLFLQKKEKDLEKFTYTKVRPSYVIKKKEVDYQRKGLNDRGWELLPDNCTYCTDESIVELLVEEGNLSESFLENWVDGETALYAWW